MEEVFSSGASMAIAAVVAGLVTFLGVWLFERTTRDIDEWAELRARIEQAVEESVLFLVRCQETEGEYAGAIPRGVRRMPNTPAYADFNARLTELRIDYVQHALSAMIQYDSLPSSSRPPRTGHLGESQD